MAEVPNSPILVVAGPTASGKSDVALHIAEEFNGAVVNADSMQVYRDLRILTARPGFPATARVPHLLYGAVPGAEPCSVGRWLEMAVAAIGEVRAMGRVPVVVGGTGLYLKALLEGLSPIPEIPQASRTEARALFQELGPEAFHRRLAELDGEAAERLATGDTQRLIRAYEVVRATGRTLSDWQREGGTRPPVPGPVASIVLVPPRAALYASIDARFHRMVEDGALDEVRALLAAGLDPKLPVMKAVGVREFADFLAGRTAMDAAVDAAKKASRNYAKRQFTWLRHQIAGSFVTSAQYSEREKQKIFSFIRHQVLTGQS